MSKPAEIKRKLKALATPGVRALITEVLMLYDKESENYSEEAGIVGYSRYVEKLCQRIKAQCERELKREEITARQRDLEDLIAEIKQEENDRKQQKSL